MENTIKDRFMFTYESGVTGSFLVASTSKDDNIIEFQVNMLAKNPNKYILPLDVRRNNDKINIYYNVTSKLSLSQYLKRSQLSKNEFLDIFSGIVKTLLNSKGYLLSDNSFLLDEDYIYISPDTMCISLVYLPVKLEVDIIKALRDFAINFAVYSANIYEENSDGFLQQFLNFLKKDNFNIIDFDKFLKEMKRLVVKQQKDADEVQGIQKKEQIPENTETQQKTEEDSKPNKFKVEIPKAKAVETKKKETNVEDNKIKHSFSGNLNIIIGGAIQAVMVVIVLVLVFSGKLDSLGDDKVTTTLGILLVCAAASYFMWKNVLKINFSDPKNHQNNSLENNKTENKSLNKPENKPVNNRPSGRTVERPPVVPKKQNEPKTPEVKRSIPNEDKYINKPMHAPIKISGNLNETVLLDSSVTKRPRLQILKDSGVEEVAINKPSFIIGRLEGQVDYVHSNNAIGKVHAEIITREGCYYLKDLNSKNGTYINGKRLDSNKEYEIKNNDKITLANSEFVFILM